MKIPRPAFRWPWPRSPGATEATAQAILAKVNHMDQGLVDLQTAVASVETMEATVIAELQALQQAAGDPDATVESLAQRINTAVSNINAAIPQPSPASNAAGTSAQSAAPGAQSPGA